jgi:hypothetical protein
MGRNRLGIGAYGCFEFGDGQVEQSVRLALLSSRQLLIESRGPPAATAMQAASRKTAVNKNEIRRIRMVEILPVQLDAARYRYTIFPIEGIGNSEFLVSLKWYGAIFPPSHVRKQQVHHQEFHPSRHRRDWRPFWP